jgi:hypothetical protein
VAFHVEFAALVSFVGLAAWLMLIMVLIWSLNEMWKKYILTPLSVIGPSGATEGLKVPCLWLIESGLLRVLMVIFDV